MNKVTIQTIRLLETIRANRTAHRDLFLKAQQGYRQDVIEELDRMLADARDGKEIRRSIVMPEPEDHTDDYDRVIKMLEMSVHMEIEIDSRQFDQFVMDNWDWKQHVTASNTFYAAKAFK